MDAEEAKSELDIAIYRVHQSHTALDGAVDAWRMAKAADRDNTRYRQYRRRHGGNFVEQFEADIDRAKRECAEAEKKLDKAKATYKAVTGLDPY